LYHTDDNLKFRPEINKNSQIIVNKKREKSADQISQFQSQNSNANHPIELELFKDAGKRKEKLKKIEYNNMMSILLNASKTKISNNSHRIAMTKIEKMIDASVSKLENDKNSKKLSFINVGEILTELKLFREVFSKKKEDKNAKYQTYKDIKIELKGIKESEKRKKVKLISMSSYG